MHHTLETPEILCLIFKCGITERDLFSCAQVCRLWGSWATDILWRTSRVSLQGVLRVLAPVTERTITSDWRIIPLFEIGNIEEHGWRRFLALSCKISQVKIDCGITGASLERIKLAKRTFNGEPFGQLHTLTMEIPDRDHNAISLVTVQSLSSVYVRCESLENNSLAWVNNNLPATAPNITRFGMGWYGTRLDFSRYSALKYIEVCSGSVRPHFWENLASCRLLTKLLLENCRVVDEWQEQWRVDYVHFPALSTFKIRGGHLRAALKLILRSRMPMLERLAWDSRTEVGDEKNLMISHLKAYSPKLDVDALYASSNFDDGGFTDSDEEWW